MTTQRQVTQRSYRDFLNRAAVFSLGDLAEVTGGANTHARARERVKYYLATGRVRRIARELYAVVPPGADPRRFQPDPFLVAATLRADAVFSHHGALELLGAAHSDWNVCTAYTGRSRSTLRLGTTTLRLLHPPGALAPRDWSRLAVREAHHLGRTLRVTSPERTLVEGFRQPQLAGGLPELVESASGFASLDVPLLARVLEAYDQRSLWAATGWFLERFARTFHVTEAQLARFESHRPRSPQYLPRRMRGGVFLPRWNLVLPAPVVRGGERDDAGP
ncbi:MAG: hypothetical protein HZC42_10560 [Candidatus Eisenbacteria bacterium]|nr:hypothetical protein [Candidatus Eisenbacteria bacterium]